MNRTGAPRWVFAWAALVALLGSAPVVAQQPFGGGDLGGLGGKPRHITFEARVYPMDPFSEFNREKSPPDTKLEVRRGETFFLKITGTPQKGYHTYPLTVRTPQQQLGQLSTLTPQPSEYLTPLYPVAETPAEFKDEGPGVGVFLEHEGPFSWTQEFYVQPGAPPGKTLDLTLKIHNYVCKDTCADEDQEMTVPITISTAEAVQPTAELKKRLEVKSPPPPEVRTPPGAGAGGGSGFDSSGGQKATGLWASLAKAILGGLISLLTPCVFPMIPITVSFFLKQSEARQHRALSLALVYSLTIVLVLAAGGLLLMRVLINVSQHWATNFALAGIFLFFALSLLGMYDITLPSWLTNLTSSQEGQGGLVGTFFMALTFSIISFTCVGPIYGGFIAFEASGQSTAANWLQQVLSVLGFSVAFASPFFVLALFPSLLRSLPRSGAWMNSVKVVMGFLELAAVFKFLRSGELYLTGKPDWFTFDLVLGVWVALAIACGLYLLNVYRLPHDHDSPETIGVPRLLFSLVFLGLGLYMLPGLFKTAQGAPQKPGGELFSQIEAFLLPESGGGGNLPEGLAKAQKEGKLVFIDFTGIT